MEEQTQRILDHPAAKPILCGVVGFLGGVAVGYILGQRNQRTQPPPPEELAKISAEINALRAKREAKESENTIIDEDDIVVPGRSYMDEMIADPDIRTEGPDIIITRTADENWDYEVEKQNRDSLSPYVIHTDEFFSNEMDLAQHTWTYYEGDDVMVNEEDVVVYNYEQKTGDLKFGHGSGDPNTVYIRNEKMRMEMEVLREEGLYSIEVMGMEVDRGENVEHSNMKKNKWSNHDE